MRSRKKACFHSIRISIRDKRNLQSHASRINPVISTVTVAVLTWIYPWPRLISRSDVNHLISSSFATGCLFATPWQCVTNVQSPRSLTKHSLLPWQPVSTGSARLSIYLHSVGWFRHSQVLKNRRTAEVVLYFLVTLLGESIIYWNSWPLFQHISHFPLLYYK